jgi:hypothetical protein
MRFASTTIPQVFAVESQVSFFVEQRALGSDIDFAEDRPDAKDKQNTSG